MDSDYHNAVFLYVYGQRITPKGFLCFSPDFVAHHVTSFSVVETPTLPQVVFKG